jgi:quercetin dioxygenase-like cupin family protein
MEGEETTPTASPFHVQAGFRGRVTLVGLKAGGTLRSHRADGPITIHVVEGAIDFEVGGTVWPLPAGTLFSLEAGMAHSVTSADGGIFLLTVVAMPVDRSAGEA